ncbi:hypothetical protein VNO77_04568 [Canavalia gladiata]|uniref:Uncharacterized protein n=1 Tax=Canavalia gladiata TaxID=3824 RepID=A0AAN9N2E4_CANGL
MAFAIREKLHVGFADKENGKVGWGRKRNIESQGAKREGRNEAEYKVYQRLIMAEREVRETEEYVVEKVGGVGYKREGYWGR